MKRFLLALTFVLSLLTSAQSQEWLTDMDEARQKATELERPILLVFQGSDWCVPCMKLQHEIWDSEAFKTYAADSLVLLKADFPRKKANKLSDEQRSKNDKLAEQYNLEGTFPLVVILDARGKVLGTTGYKHISPAEYISLLYKF